MTHHTTHYDIVLRNMMSLHITNHGVLVEVVVGAAGDGVELHDVVKVGHLSAHPPLSEARVLQQSGWFADADSVEVRCAQTDDTAVHL